MSSLFVTIYTPKGLLYDGEALSLYVPSANGPLGILPGHTPYIAALAKSGVASLTLPSHEVAYFALHFGALEVKKERTYLLSEECARFSSLPEAEAWLSKPSPTLENKNKEAERAKAAIISKTPRG